MSLNPFRWLYLRYLHVRNARRRRRESLPSELEVWQKGETIPLKGYDWRVGDLRPPTAEFPRSVLILACDRPTRRALKQKLSFLKRIVPKEAIRALDKSKRVH
jgi:hypothetical protein